jgi:hypothetical protein
MQRHTGPHVAQRDGSIKPSADKAAPSADKAAPSADKAAPSADKAAPSADRAAPSADRAAPSADRAAPSADDDLFAFALALPAQSTRAVQESVDEETLGRAVSLVETPLLQTLSRWKDVAMDQAQAMKALLATI